jgi:hypothetical protein
MMRVFSASDLAVLDALGIPSPRRGGGRYRVHDLNVKLIRSC